jgi:hypothetical protein
MFCPIRDMNNRSTVSWHWEGWKEVAGAGLGVGVKAPAFVTGIDCNDATLQPQGYTVPTVSPRKISACFDSPLLPS